MEKRLFIVGIVEGDLMKKAIVLQKLFAEKYQLYHNSLPNLHITLEIVEEDENNLGKIRDAVMRVSQHIEKFTVRATGFACFPPPYKSVGLLIEKTTELTYAINTVEEYLDIYGIKSVKPFGSEFVYHLTLANTFLADRKWSEAEFFEACAMVDRVKAPLSLSGTLSQIAIWHPVRDAKKMSQGTFDLLERETAWSKL